MKAAVVALVILLSSLALAQLTGTRISSAGADFVTPDQSVNGVINVNRTKDPVTKVITTELFFRLCSSDGTVVNCQEGNGRIPPSALIGDVTDQANRRDTLTVLVDTAAIEGSSGCNTPGGTPCFSNFMCFNHDEFDDCNGGQGPAVGGLVSMTWVKTTAFETILDDVAKQYDHGKLTLSENTSSFTFTANQTGTVLGLTTNGSGFMSNFADIQRMRNKLAGRGRGQ
jgi:hypothetical protein